MTLWTPEISETTVITVGFIQGISIGFLAIPINIIAFATLPSAIRTEATSIYSLMRNLGSAIGISITGALLETNTQVNHALIAEDVTPFNRALQHGRRGADSGIPRRPHGMALLNEQVTRQARIIAYIDDFKLMLVLAILVLPLLLFVRTPRQGYQLAGQRELQRFRCVACGPAATSRTGHLRFLAPRGACIALTNQNGTLGQHSRRAVVAPARASSPRYLTCSMNARSLGRTWRRSG